MIAAFSDDNRIMTVLTDIVTGAVFGSALTISGVYKPAVIISQMQLRNFHMLQSFLTASAASAYVSPSHPATASSTHLKVQG
jgi:hypothetical protein